MKSFRLLALAAVSALALLRPALAADAIEAKVDALLAQMTLEEKVGQLTMASNEKTLDWQAMETGGIGSVLNFATPESVASLLQRAHSRLGIPLLVALDVIHGYRTIFPVPLADAASFDPAVTFRSAELSAREARASGIGLTFAPMSDLAHDPRWGRIVEGSGEDPVLASAFTAARVKGFKAGGLATTVKHFAGYGAVDGGRDYDSIDISEAELRDRYLPTYRAGIDAGADSVMTAYVALGGVPATANRHLLKDILRGEWGFDRAIMSDLHSIQEMVSHGTAADGADAAVKAFLAGVDIDMDAGLYQHHLADAVKTGKVPLDLIDQATRRVLLLKAGLGLFDQAPLDPAVAELKLNTPETRTAARELARQTFVLLKNDNHTLPIPDAVRTIAVVGSLADSQPDHLGPDAGIAHDDETVTLLKALKARAGDRYNIVYAPGCDRHCADADGITAAVTAASGADYVVLAIGEARDMAGEGGSRADLAPPGHQAELIDAIARLGKPTAAVLYTGRAMALEAVAPKLGAILLAWYPGSEGGNALTDVLFGDVVPSGKLPVTFPRVTGQVPIVYNHLPTGRPADPTDRYTSKYVDIGIGPLYPFGWGLSYTEFAYSEPKLISDKLAPEDRLTVRISVRNTGTRQGAEVVQLYTHQRVAERSRPVRELKAFQKVMLAPGEEKSVELSVPAEGLAYWNAAGEHVLEPGTFDYWVGGNSGATLGGHFTVTAGSRLVARAK
ncbi:MAG: glycoside hydrolase family 3 N-terminal domain-containing protein [Ancalomicrobiaceae bacterium]|nr:glycoside hydrolase family 3 N-terminal domain-containing protein [Ancalomicrobiaceae bacterium]